MWFSPVAILSAATVLSILGDGKWIVDAENFSDIPQGKTQKQTDISRSSLRRPLSNDNAHLKVSVGESSHESIAEEVKEKQKGEDLADNIKDQLPKEDGSYRARFLQDTFPRIPLEREVKVDITCETEDGIDCKKLPLEGPGTCEKKKKIDVEYTVCNVGPTTKNINKLSITRNGITRDRTGDLPDTKLTPSECVKIEKNGRVDTCEAECYETMAEVDATAPGGKPFEDKVNYKFCIEPEDEPPCEVEAIITCETEDGLHCTRIPGGGGGEDCEDIEQMYTYEICNIGPIDMTIDQVATTRNGRTQDLTKLVENTKVAPGECTEVTENGTIDNCEEECYETLLEVDATNPSGKPCFAEDIFQFCIEPQPPEECNVAVDVTCAGTESGTDCGDLQPNATLCENRPTEMSFKFNGGGCSQSFNLQQADQFQCADFTVDGTTGAPTSGEAYILMHALENIDEIYFSGYVEVGLEFPLFNDGERFDSDTVFFVGVDQASCEAAARATYGLPSPGLAGLYQGGYFDSSCSQNLFLMDKFGSLQLVVFVNEEQGPVTSFIEATYSYNITNTGENVENAIITAFTSCRTIGGEPDPPGRCTDLLGILGSHEIPPGGMITVTENALIDMTVQQEYKTTATIVGETQGGIECSDENVLTFTVGMPGLRTSHASVWASQADLKKEEV